MSGWPAVLWRIIRRNVNPSGIRADDAVMQIARDQNPLRPVGPYCPFVPSRRYNRRKNAHHIQHTVVRMGGRR